MQTESESDFTRCRITPNRSTIAPNTAIIL